MRMIVGKRARLIGLMLGAVAVPALATGSGAQTAKKVATAPATAAKPSQPWTQAISDVPADKAVRFGTLPNGMRYAIMHNATPPRQSSLMLRIDAGSLMEKDDQLGLAHFMEHMAFNGTKDIPKNDLIAILQRLGLAFGADLNAATGFDQTFYQLHLPESDDKTVDTGLFVLRQQVSEATMDPQDIVDERGVIAGEERLRNSPSLRVSRQQLALLAKGQKVVDRFPIGDLRIINTAPRAKFVDFYNSYYRPSRATLVAVGDFDVDAMEAKIRKQFADWQPKGPEGANPDLGKVAAHDGETRITVEPGIPSNVTLSWTRAPDLAPDTMAKRRQDIVEGLGLAVLNRRLSELSRTDDAPFISAQSADDNLVRSVRISAVTAQFIPGKWQRALETIDQEQRRIAQFGVTDAELTREINAYRTRYETAAKGAATRDTRGLAGGLITSVNERQVFTAPDTDLALFDAAVKGLTPAQVDAVLKQVFAGTPMTLIASPVAIEGGETAVAAAAKAARQVAVTAPKAPEKMPWPYTDFGKPGVVVARRDIPDLGATIVTFQNGVTLTVKQTDFSKDSVSVNLLTGQGEQNFAPDKIDPRLVMIGGLRAGGLGKMNVDEMSRSLNGRLVGASLSTLGDRFMLSGGTRPADLQLQMQVMAAYLTDPAYRSTPFELTKASYPASYDAALALPGGAFSVYAAKLLAGGDQRTGILSPDQISGMSVDAYRAQLKALLGEGPIHIAMVGDVSVDDAIKVTADTFGALPSRPALGVPAPGADVRRFPAPTAEPLEFTHKGLAEQSLGYVAWPTVDATHDLTEARRVEVLAAVLRLRVLDEIREKEGLAYSPGVSSSYSDTYKGYGALSVQAQTAPDKLPAFFKAVDAIVDKLRNEPVTADELKRAREPIIEGTKRGMTTNYWWLSQLTFLVDRPWYEPQALTSIRDMEALTPADVQALAKKYLRSDLAWKAEVLPAAKGAAVPAAKTAAK